MKTLDISHLEEIYTVSRLNREVRYLLEGNFPPFWIEGEISNFSTPQSGHWYFSLKDAAAQIRCAMFKPQNRQLDFRPQDGMHVLMKARVSLYEGRGDFQLLVEHLEEAGEGKLRQEFEKLKKRLLEAGLFDPVHKKPLPAMPRTIGVITSPTGAAIRDILSVLKRRFSLAHVVIYPTLVQGESAAPHIVQAIELANARQECDVLILARGGGSLEDLWPFNEEKVAYAIHQSRIPLISGVGHEIDFTIADFVADQRAATPSAAAELVVPDQLDVLQLLIHHEEKLLQWIKQRFYQYQQHLSWIEKHLHQQHPKRQLLEKMQQLDFNAQHLQNLISKKIESRASRIRELAGRLDALSPLATLKRGFSITTRVKDQKIIRHAADVRVGERVRVQLMEGELECEVARETD